MSETVISVHDLGKQYAVGGAEYPHHSFREMLAGTLTAPLARLKRLRGEARKDETFWALRNLSFETGEGEIVGVIGRNGAGKSTLLKIMSRITSPTCGRVTIRGRVASLLEVGTGFHPELTGRENVFLNGAILGMRHREIERRFDEIVAFAEIEKFIDTPVKRYSSGMYVRLAFAVAAHLDTDVLLVDEVLAVGDLAFQNKCLGKMDDVQKSGRTILFVSHNLGAISRLCGKAVVLDGGRVVSLQVTNKAIQDYLALVNQNSALQARDFSGPLGQKLSFTEIFINGKARNENISVMPSEAIHIKVLGNAAKAISAYRTAISVYRDSHLIVTQQDAPEVRTLPVGDFESEVLLPPFFLSPGNYCVAIGGYADAAREWTWGYDQVMFSVMEKWSREYDTLGHMGFVNLPTFGCRRPLKG